MELIYRKCFDARIEDGWHMKDFVRRPGTELTLVIQPVRPTTGTHLRQGFIRFLTAKHAKEFGTGGITPEGQEANEAIAEFEKNFPAGNVSTKQQVIFTKKADNSLRMQFDNVELCTIKSRWLAERLFEGYLSHEKPISNKMRASVAQGLLASV
ncbi:chalcone isomerase [Chytridium lagenaria]|nr:chalcone isomerase [Chytridium lagenaria]